jgi:hypothetical protein
MPAGCGSFMPQNLTGRPVPTDEARAELDRVLHGAAFQRAERLQNFLQFVCELTLNGEASRINEYLIGSEVFQRGPDYSPSEDSIVRRQAHTLRRKLQEHYDTAGRESAIRIELPTGGYIPVFRRREEIASGATEPAIEPALPIPPQVPPPVTQRAVPPSFNRTYIMAGLAAAAAVIFLAGWLTKRNITTDPLIGLDPAVRQIWGDWLQDHNGVVICFSNPLTAVLKHFSVPLPAGSVPRRLPLTREQEEAVRTEFKLPPGGYMYFAPAVSQAKMGEAIGAVSLASLFAGARVPVRTTQSRFVTWEDLPKQNFVIMGHDEANRWIDPLLEHSPFRLSPTRGGKQRAIVNTAPQPGEAAEYEIRYSPEDLTDPIQEYVLISMVPGVDGHHKLLLISGLNTQATLGAAEFLTQPERLRELVAELGKRAPGHRGPWHFQAVLSTEVHDKVPIKASLVALRILP